MQVHRLDQPPIGGNTVAGFQQYDVAGHQLNRADFVHVPITPHANLRGLHRTQRGQRLLGLIFLEEAKPGVEQDDRQDDDGVFDVSNCD